MQSDEKMAGLNVTLGNQNASLNFIFGLSNLPEDFDILQNPYVEFVGYELKPGEDGKVKFSEKYGLEICS